MLARVLAMLARVLAMLARVLAMLARVLAMALCLSVTSRCSVEMEGRIELIFGM